MRRPTGISELSRVTNAAQLDALVAQRVSTLVPLPQRAWRRSVLDVGDSVRVLQFNTLARGLSSSPYVPPPFPARQASQYGGFDAINDPEKVLDWKVRRWKVLHEILRMKAAVIALEEVDHYDDFLRPALRAAGYDSCYEPVADAPGLKLGYYSDGVVLAWQRSAFSLVGINAQSSHTGGRASIVATLRHGESRRPLVVAATHLTSKTGPDRENLRLAQIEHLLGEMSAAIASVQLRMGPTSPCPAILLGDLNTDPHDVTTPNSHEARVVPRLLSAGLTSAYPLAASEADHAQSDYWTTWKRRGTYCAKHQIDYIFYRHMTCISLLMPPDVTDPNGLPNLAYPSDHISICAELTFAGDA